MNKLFNVRVSSVQLVWAPDAGKAMRYARQNLRDEGFEPLTGQDDEAFLSEPIPEKGWDG